MSRFLRFALVLSMVASTASALQTDDDPPSRVARLNYTNGVVTLRAAGVDDFAPATINRPIVSGDQLWVDRQSRAELHLGASAIRLDSETSVEVLGLDDQIAQFRLAQGTIQLRLRGIAENETWEVDAPNGSVSLLKAGTYRIDVSPDGETTTVTLRDGEAEVAASDGTFAVRADETATINGSADQQSHEIADAGEPDELDRWSSSRDSRDDGAFANNHVPRGVLGYEDLNDNGDWRNDASYGWVWTPRRVAADWAPYRSGHWAWIEPWGWTWIDDARWGFAPFHYGRWAYASAGWFWVPGRISRPIYAPALVAFGGGSGWHASASFGPGGGVAWFPLGPGEVYVPTYHTAHNYVRLINGSVIRDPHFDYDHIDVAHLHYANRGVVGGITVVSSDTFTHARPVSAGFIHVSAHDLAGVAVIGTAAPFAPRRESVIGRSFASDSHFAHPPAGVIERHVVARTAPPPPPLSFAARSGFLAQHPGQPIAPHDYQHLRADDHHDGHALVTPVGHDGFHEAPTHHAFVPGANPADHQSPKPSTIDHHDHADDHKSAPKTFNPKLKDTNPSPSAPGDGQSFDHHNHGEQHDANSKSHDADTPKPDADSGQHGRSHAADHPAADQHPADQHSGDQHANDHKSSDHHDKSEKSDKHPKKSSDEKPKKEKHE